MRNATARYTEQRWDETTFVEAEGLKLARAEVAVRYTGDLDATSTLTWVMTYLLDGTGSFTGFEHVTGVLGGRRGSFVLYHEGSFDATAARSAVTVVVGSGTADLAGLRGEGRAEAAYADASYPLQLTWMLDPAAARAGEAAAVGGAG